MNAQTFSYIPTGHNVRPTELETHEYFGEDYVAGKSTVAIFETIDMGMSGKPAKQRAVWSYGDWSTYGLKEGDIVYFQHTQTMRTVPLRFVGIAHRDEDRSAFGSKKITQWTLK